MQIKVNRPDLSIEAKELQNWLHTHLGGYFIVADAKAPDWQNDDSTLVLRHNPDGISLDFSTGLGLGQMATEFGAGRFDHTVEDYVTYYRLWWD